MAVRRGSGEGWEWEWEWDGYVPHGAGGERTEEGIKQKGSGVATMAEQWQRKRVVKAYG